jgi:hypothetical protein
MLTLSDLLFDQIAIYLLAGQIVWRIHLQLLVGMDTVPPDHVPPATETKPGEPKRGNGVRDDVL